MNEHNPDNWVVLKIKEGKGTFPYYKVLAGWSGGYTQGDSWRMNSGITSVEKQAYLYGFYGWSGSVYWCHQSSYGLTFDTAGVYNRLRENQQFKGQVFMMPEDTNWSDIDWRVK